MAILKKKPKPVVEGETSVKLESNALKVKRALEVAIGRPPDSPKEQRTITAAAAVLTGGMGYTEAERLYAVSNAEIKRFLDRTFPSDDEKYEFLENCMLSNAVLASSIFAQKFAELSAIDAARATAIFAGKATDIRKAREAGFKETPMSVTTIVSLEKTLKNLTIQNAQET